MLAQYGGQMANDLFSCDYPNYREYIEEGEGEIEVTCLLVMGRVIAVVYKTTDGLMCGAIVVDNTVSFCGVTKAETGMDLIADILGGLNNDYQGRAENC